MAGLPCDVCQEETTVMSNGEAGTLENGVLFYRRYRVCTNPKCPRCGEVRNTGEAFLPDPETVRKVSAREVKRLRKAGDCDSSQPPLFSSS